MRRRLSAIAAALAVTQFSLGNMVTPCRQPSQTLHDAASHSQHSAAGMNCQARAVRTSINGVSHGGMPACDYSGSGGCADRTSCTGQVALVEAHHFAAVLPAGSAPQPVLSLTARPNRAPEPPPPRI